MGMQRGALESAALGEIAKSANPTYHERNSIASGLAAHARGVVNLAQGYKALGGAMGDIANFLNAMEGQTAKVNDTQGKSIGAVNSANKAFQTVKDELKAKQASNKALTDDDFAKLNSAKNNYNDSINRLQVNQMWQFKFKGDYKTMNGTREELLRDDPYDDKYTH
jgi:hypothetical protein